MQVFDNINRKLIDGLREINLKNSSLSIAGSVFSIYAYEALRRELNDISKLRFLYTAPTFAENKVKKELREFFIPQLNRERALFGSSFEIKLRNQLTQRAVARECADWIRRCGIFKSCLDEGAMVGEVLVSSSDNVAQFMPVQEFTTTALGVEKGSTYATQIVQLSSSVAETALGQFNVIWDDPAKVKDVTAEVLESIETLYRENSPEFLYFVTLSNIFSQFLDDTTNDELPNDGTGFKKSLIWQKLFNFQKDAAFAIIQKLEKYNGCILADSVGLGKTFTALAVIKYYESRNFRVLVLCPKKLSNNWTTWKSNYRTNILSADRLRYDVLYHSDLSRKRGFSNGIDLSQINWGNYDLVVIDESHNFRNGYSTNSEVENRYQRLMNLIIKDGVKTKVLMLSATPVNNRFADLRNQLQFAYEGDLKQMDKRLTLKAGVEETFRQAQKTYNQWSKLPADERTISSLQKALPFDFFEILDAVTIARSRRHIERYYDMADVGKFPKRLAPISRRPQLTDLPNVPTYKDIFKTLIQLNLSVYTPSAFILPHKLDKYSELGGSVGLTQRGRELGIRRLMSVNLLKRLESSVASFRLSIERVREQIIKTLEQIHCHEKGSSINGGESDYALDSEEIEENENLISVETKKISIELSDIDTVQWAQYLRQDLDLLNSLLNRIKEINAKHDRKLGQLLNDLAEKIEKPINPGNRKVIIFTAFADTAEYLYEHVAPFMKTTYGVNTALVTGNIEARTNLKSNQKMDFNTVLTLFSPKSKEKAIACPNIEGEIDILIATDCISEGQNLQDCDLMINFDIHWNPVRIIQRFGRIDRIGSENEVIKLVNYWPDLELDEYIDLKARVESRMKASVLSSTGDENPLSTEEQNELHYRDEQLKRLQNEILDLEDMNSGISILDLGLNDFRMDLVAYIKDHPEVKKAPQGLHAVISPDDDSPEGVIFVLKSIKEDKPLDTRNRIHPFYMVYISSDGEIFINHLEPKAMLDRLRHFAKGCVDPNRKLCDLFNKETRDGNRMNRYSELLNKVISAISEGKEKSSLEAFLEGESEPLFGEDKSDINDFELVSFFVIKAGA